MAEESHSSLATLQSQLEEFKEKSRKEITDSQKQAKDRGAEVEKMQFNMGRLQDEVRPGLVGRGSPRCPLHGDVSHVGTPSPAAPQVARLKQALQDSQAERESALLDKEVLLQRLRNLEQEMETKKRSQDDRSRHVKALEVGSAARRPATARPVPAVLCANSKGQSSPSHPPSRSRCGRGAWQRWGGVLLILIFIHRQHSRLCFGSVRHCRAARLAQAVALRVAPPPGGRWVARGSAQHQASPFSCFLGCAGAPRPVGFCWAGSKPPSPSIPACWPQPRLPPVPSLWGPQGQR